MSVISNFLSSAKPKGASRAPPDIYKQDRLAISLNGISLNYKKGLGWVSESNDLVKAADSLESALHQVDMLELENEDLRSELTESNELRNIAMAMLMEEKTRAVALEKELEGYKIELKKAFTALNAHKKLLDIDKN